MLHAGDHVPFPVTEAKLQNEEAEPDWSAGESMPVWHQLHAAHEGTEDKWTPTQPYQLLMEHKDGISDLLPAGGGPTERLW